MREPRNDRLVYEDLGFNVVWRQRFERLFLFERCRYVGALVDGAAELFLERLIVFARITPRFGRDLGGQQVHDDAVLVSGPDRTVFSEKRSARTLLSTEAVRPVEQTVHEPFEANGHLREAAAQATRDTVDHRARDQRFPDRRILGPSRPVSEEVVDRHGEIVVRIHQATTARYDTVSVVVGIVPEGDVVAILDRKSVV